MTSSDQNDETESLLSQEEQSPVSHRHSFTRHFPLLSPAAFKAFWNQEAQLILLCAFLLQFLISFAKHVIEVPTIRLFELAACREYYRRLHGPTVSVNDPGGCKVPQVQDELSILTGYKFGFDAVPGLLLAVYYGSVAGKYGRKRVLFLFSTGMLLNLAWIVLVCRVDQMPVRLVWLSSIFTLIGGGSRVAKAMLFTIISDTVDAQHRTRYMYLLSSIPHLTTLIAPPFSAIFMRISIRLPFEIAIGALVLTYVFIFAMPESLQLEHPAEDCDSASSFSASERTLLLPNEVAPEPPREEPSKRMRWWAEILELLQIPGLRVCLLLFFFAPIALIAKTLVYQYASESFSWEMSNTTWLRVSQAGGASLVTIITLPALTAILHRRGVHARNLDLGVIRGSLFIASVGFAMLWQSKASWMLILALFVCGLSEGLQPSNQGLATSLISREYNARLFTTVAVLETVGKLTGGVLQPTLFSIGRAHHHGSLGINFLTSSAIFLLLLGLTLVAGVKKRDL